MKKDMAENVKYTCPIIANRIVISDTAGRAACLSIATSIQTFDFLVLFIQIVHTQ